MNKSSFIQAVQAMTGLPTREMAESATQIVLSLLSHRLTPDESEQVESQLSADMKPMWRSDTWIVNFLSLSHQGQLKYRHRAELYSLIDNELQKRHIPIGAEQLAVCVFHVLKDQVDPGEADDIAAQLPGDIEALWVAA